jgi:CheY-like chemotaxis protein
MTDNDPILVVDDEVDFVSTYERVLRRHGYRVISGGSRCAALALLERQPLLLLVTDVRCRTAMPWISSAPCGNCPTRLLRSSSRASAVEQLRSRRELPRISASRFRSPPSRRSLKTRWDTDPASSHE